MSETNDDRDLYEALRRQIDTMPVGMPRTADGTEIRILRHLFTPEEARVALHLNLNPETAEHIGRRMARAGIAMDTASLEAVLERMVLKGAIRCDREMSPRGYAYALFAVGMYEFQVDRMDVDFYRDCERYLVGEFGKAYHEFKFPQLRTVPVARSVTPERPVATYDDMRQAIARAQGRFALLNCICKQGKDLVHEPCRATDVRETCIIFPGTAEHYLAFGTGRAVTRDEALAALDRAEEAGLIIQPTNSREPVAICCCCGCCCGAITSAKKFPRPAELFATNYYAAVDCTTCRGTHLCVKRCQMDAIMIREGTAVINRDRCIGCGLCVSVCPNRSITLVAKRRPVVPPRDTTAYYTRLLIKRVGVFRALRTGLRLKLGLKG